MIRFVIWATLKDYFGWRPSDIMGGHDSDYWRWKAMKEAHKKDYSIGAAIKEGFEKGQKKQPQKKEMDIQMNIQISGEGLTVEKLDGFNDVTLQSHGVILIGGKPYSLREVIEVFVNHKREEAE